MDFLTASIAMRFGNIPLALASFYDAAYNDERKERRQQDITVQPLNESQLYFIFQVLVRNDKFNHYTPIQQRMTALISGHGTRKNKTITYMVAATLSLLVDRGTSLLRTGQLSRR